MRFYELTSLFSSKLSEEEIKNLSEKITSFIREEGGILDKLSAPLRKKLAYPIKKEREAYLLSLEFYLDPQKLENLEKKLKEESEIIRFLLINKKVQKEMKKPQKLLETTPKIETPKEEKVDIKEIEEKLEEILGEI